MNQVNKVILFILFLEEYLLWHPGSGRFNSLCEKLAHIFIKGVGDPNFYAPVDGLYLYYINPALCYFLLLISAGPLISYIKSIISENARANILIWLERHSYIRVVLAAILGIIFITQLLNILDNPSITLLALYQNKFLWTVVFGSMLIKRFLKKNAWDV